MSTGKPAPTYEESIAIVRAILPYNCIRPTLDILPPWGMKPRDHYQRVMPHVVYPGGGDPKNLAPGAQPHLCYRDPGTDRWLTSRPGKAVKRILELLWNDGDGALAYNPLAGFDAKAVQQYCDDLAGIVLLNYTAATLHLASNQEDITRVYQKGPSSCMRAAGMPKICGRVYGGSPDIEVAYITVSDKPDNTQVTGRAVVWNAPDGNKYYCRIYGDRRRLEASLVRSGYVLKDEDWLGVRLPIIPDEDEGDHSWLMPYLDFARRVDLADGWFVSSRSGVHADSTEGFIHAIIQESALIRSEPDFHECTNCGADFPPDDLTWYAPLGEEICPDCVPRNWEGDPIPPDEYSRYECLDDGVFYLSDEVFPCPLLPSRTIHDSMSSVDWVVMESEPGGELVVKLATISNFRYPLHGQPTMTRSRTSVAGITSATNPIFVAANLADPEHPRHVEAMRMAGKEVADAPA